MFKSFLAFFLLFLPNLFSADEIPKKPVYVCLYARFDDHINTALTAERLKRTLAVLEKLRHDYPAANPSALFQFSGAAAQALSDQNDKQGLVDLVRKAQRDALVEAGYDGANEPAYNAWPPMPDLRSMGGMERWDRRFGIRSHFLADYRDPLTGAADPTRPGGLREVEQVFGPVLGMSNLSPELGGDPEVVQELRRMHKHPLLVEIPNPDPDPAKRREGYGGLVIAFERQIAPEPDIAPEVYWLDDVLRSAEFGGRIVHAVDATLGVTQMKKMLEALDRSRPHVLRVELSTEHLYLTEQYAKGSMYPPVAYAYKHPQQPQLPADALRPKEDIDEAYQRQDDLMHFLTTEVFPANPGSRFVSSSALQRMTPPPAGFDVKMDALINAAAGMLKDWGQNTTTPNYAMAGGRYLSIADMFQLMTTALAERHQSGKWPEQVRLNPVFGPLDFTDNFGDNKGSVSVAGVERACADLAPHLNRQDLSREPENVIPTFLVVDGQSMNAGSFLRIMAQALTTPDTRFDIRVSMLVTYLGLGYPHSRVRADFGSVWTLKPAPLNLQ